MIRQILNLGKLDNRNPFEVLRKVGERLDLEGFLKEGEELPAVINKLLGKGEVKGIEGLKNNVFFSTYEKAYTLIEITDFSIVR